MPVITNTTIISNFACVGELPLVSKLWEIVYLPDQVYSEIQTGLHQGYNFYNNLNSYIHPFQDDGWLHLTSLNSPNEFRLFGNLLTTLHDGEAAGLSIAYHRQWTFLSDDRAARRIAKHHSIRYSGTLGILTMLVKRELITLPHADHLLDQMIAAGYYAPVTSLQELL
jgi:predicted nucleic acid-binding protein